MILFMYGAMFWFGNCNHYFMFHVELDDALDLTPQYTCQEIMRGPMPTDEVLI